MPNTYLPGQTIMLVDVITATSTLAAAVTVAATTISLTLPIGPATGTFTIQIDSEQMTVTAGQNTLTLTVTRGVNGTTPAAHLAGAQVTAYLDDPGTTVAVYKPDGTVVAPAPAISHPGLATYTAQVTPGATAADLGRWEYAFTGALVAPGRGRNWFDVSPIP